MRILIKDEPFVIGIDETLERRWGKQISARGIYRDAVRSSDSHFVKCSGLRWVSIMRGRPCGIDQSKLGQPSLGFALFDRLSSLRAVFDRQRTHKNLTCWASQLLLQVKPWAGDRAVIAVGDSTGPPGGYAVIDLLTALQGRVSLISRLRLDAALYEPVTPRPSGQRGRKRIKGKRLPTLLSVAQEPTTVWQNLVVADWYRGASRAVEYCSGTALCGAARAVSYWQAAGGYSLGTCTG